MRRMLLALLLALTACAALPALALADGDPGSDVLIDQNLFAGVENISAAQQIKLGDLLDATARAGAPVRVAIISQPAYLGTVSALWHKPQTYASYLGYELSLAYTGRLLIVMPNGLGVYWHANSSGATHLASLLSHLKPPSDKTSALVATTEAAVYRMEAAAGVKKSALAAARSATRSSPSSSASANPSQPGATSAKASATPGHHTAATGWFLAILILLALLYVAWRTKRLGKLRSAAGVLRLRSELKGVRLRPIALLPTALLLIVVVALLINRSNDTGTTATGATLATNPHLDPGTMLNGRRAPNFTLVDQTGQRVSLSQYRGKAVILAFTDAECQTICPLTTQAMVDAKADLGKAGDQLQLLGVNANWKSTQIDDVLNYTELHGMTGRWEFATGSPPQLERVWKAYGVNEEALVTKADNEIDHVAALYVIDPQGRERVLFTTYPSYASVPQFGQLLAQKVSKLLPSHPPVATRYSYAQAPQTLPTQVATLPKLGGGKVKLGPGKAHLYLFFATWDRQTIGLAADLEELNSYARDASAHGLPPITAIDEGSVEPSAQTLPRFISTLPKPLSYPVAIDQSGRVGDGYGVQGEPWFVLTDAAGKIVWYQEVYTQGWPKSLSTLDHELQDSLGNTASSSEGAGQASAQLAGSPPPLAAIHRQASKILPGGQAALDARIRALRAQGYAVVLNIWASWCQPCQAEFGLLARASALYGKDIAFLGADSDDNAADAQAFLKEHHVSYPSYETTSTSIDKILAGGLQGTPTTVFINPLGGMFVHPYNYTSLGALQADIQAHALGSGG